jgi:hypothetical protein
VRGKNNVVSFVILIIVLCIHLVLLYLFARNILSFHQFNSVLNQNSETAYIYIPMSIPDPSPILPEPVHTPPPPTPKLEEQQILNPQPQPPDENFASLFKKIESVEPSQELPENTDNSQQFIDNKNGNITVKIKKTKPDIENNNTRSEPSHPKDVATDDVPIPFLGVNTTKLTERDTLFHTFIKAVNTAIYKSMQTSNPPYYPGAQPILLRLVIVRTGRLAQAPTIIRSSGNRERDLWYIATIQQASADFPPIPPAIHLPFAELTFKEGTRGNTPLH